MSRRFLGVLVVTVVAVLLSVAIGRDLMARPQSTAVAPMVAPTGSTGHAGTALITVDRQRSSDSARQDSQTQRARP